MSCATFRNRVHSGLTVSSGRVEAIAADTEYQDEQQTLADPPAESGEPPPAWALLTKVAWRFCVVYFGLFCLLFAQITYTFTGIVNQFLPEGAVLWQMITLDPLLSWVGGHMFGAGAGLHLDSNSGDQSVIWVMVFCILVVAAVATALWTLLDRHRPSYSRANAWFLVFLRLCLGGQMFFYGVAKVIPTQMPEPPLAALLRPYGQLSPASVLWLQVGSSPVYEIALGTVELVAGLLLFLPRTATLGALLSLISMGQVFLLNMTFDVPVKILSFHLLLISLVLLAPQLQKLANVFVLQRPSEPVSQPALFRAERANRTATLVQVIIGVWMLIGCIGTGVTAWNDYGGGRTKPPLYGIWAVGEFTVDGNPVQPLTTDQTRWQRVVFDTPDVLTVQRMDGELVDRPVTVDADAHTIALAGDQPPTGRFDFTRTQDELRLTGQLDGREVTMVMQRVDANSFPLRSRGFHWVQDYPHFQ